MPTKYTPTGNPRGRPPKVDKPAEPESAVTVHKDARALLNERNVDPRSRPLTAICPECFPLGWLPEQRATCCEHGIWVKR